jgi:hypothetical protein
VFCLDCGTWNRSALRQCAQGTLNFSDLLAVVDAPDHLITSLRHATGTPH